jgi:CheY-like chemotaxis protein
MCILSVEDDVVVATGVEEALRREGRSFDHCLSAEDALSAIATTGYDPAIVDIGSPGMNGRSLIDRIRRDGDGIPVISVDGETVAFLTRATGIEKTCDHRGDAIAVNTPTCTTTVAAAPSESGISMPPTSAKRSPPRSSSASAPRRPRRVPKQRDPSGGEERRHEAHVDLHEGADLPMGGASRGRRPDRPTAAGPGRSGRRGLTNGPGAVL